MKGRQLAILLGLVVVLGGIGLLLQRSNQTSWSTSGGGGAGAKVIDLPINDVAAIRIQGAGGELNLAKKGDDWVVKERADYPAGFTQVSDLLRKLWDLKTVQEVKVGPSQMPRLELVEPGKGDKAGTLVEFKDKDGKGLGALLLGKKHLRKSGEDAGPMGGGEGFATGRYVMPVGGQKVSLVSETLDDVDPKPDRWLRKDFIKIENVKSVALDGQTDAQKWKLTRENASAEWKLADARPDEQPLDTGKIGSFATLFANASFKDVLPADAKPEETGFDKPATVTYETFDGFTYTLKVGKAKDDAYPVIVAVKADLAKERTPGKDEKPEDKTKLDDEWKAKQKKLEEKLAAEKKIEGFAYLVQKWSLDPLLKDRAALLQEKKAEPAAPAAPGAAPTPGAPATVPPVSSATTPPVSATTPPISVTTPPVSAPPLPPSILAAPPATESAPAPAPAPAAAPAAPMPPPAPADAPPAAAPAAPQPTPPPPAAQPPASAPPAEPGAPAPAPAPQPQGSAPPAVPAPEAAPAPAPPAAAGATEPAPAVPPSSPAPAAPPQQ